MSSEEQLVRVEDARLKEEYDQICAFANKFLGRPLSSMGETLPPLLQRSSGSDLAVIYHGLEVYQKHFLVLPLPGSRMMQPQKCDA